MKIKSLLFSMLALAACVLAFSLWFAPQPSLNSLPLASSETAFAAHSGGAPAALPAVLASPQVAILSRSTGGTLLALLVASGIAFFMASHRTRRGHLVSAVNTLPANVGFSKMKRRYRASGAVATRWLFAKAGADDEHAAVIAATADKPIGVFSDEAAAAEDPITVELAGINGQTLPCVASAAIATLNLDVYTDAAGKVMIKPTAAGTYWKVGRNLTLAGAANDPVEVQLCEPRKLIVLAALTNVAGDIADTNSTAVNPTKADFDSLLVAAGKLQADVLLIAAALASGADIDFATT